jgi:hypothetical protein
VIRGLAEEGEAVAGMGMHRDPGSGKGKGKGKQREQRDGKTQEKVWLHCVVGGVIKEPVAPHEGDAGEENSVRARENKFRNGRH